MPAIRYEPTQQELYAQSRDLPISREAMLELIHDLGAMFQPSGEPCPHCNGEGFEEWPDEENQDYVYYRCNLCNCTGSFVEFIRILNGKEAPEPYLGSRLREILQEKAGVQFCIDYGAPFPTTYKVIKTSIPWKPS